MKFKYKCVTAFLLSTFVWLVLNSCLSKTASLSDCSAPGDKIEIVQLASTLGGVNIETQIYFSSSPTECEFAMNDSLNKEQYNTVESALQSLLGFEENANVVSKAYTLFIAKDLNKDSIVSVNDVVGVSRYYTNEGKLFHQLFIKNASSFSESRELSAEVDGVIFNYVHLIAKKVLKLDPHGTGFFIKTEDSRGLYKNLKHPKDELGPKLNSWIEKDRS